MAVEPEAQRATPAKCIRLYLSKNSHDEDPQTVIARDVRRLVNAYGLPVDAKLAERFTSRVLRDSESRAAARLKIANGSGHEPGTQRTPKMKAN